MKRRDQIKLSPTDQTEFLRTAGEAALAQAPSACAEQKE